MTVELITQEDLQHFRMQLLNDIKQLIAPKESSSQKKWLKAREVQALFGISSRKLQALRISEKLYTSRIGGVLYYKNEEIQQLLQTEKS
jgi:hypothetical protein